MKDHFFLIELLEKDELLGLVTERGIYEKEVDVLQSAAYMGEYVATGMRLVEAARAGQSCFTAARHSLGFSYFLFLQMQSKNQTVT